MPLYPGAFLSHTTIDFAEIKQELSPKLKRYFGSVFLMNIGMARTGSEHQDTIVQAYKRRILTALWQSQWVLVYLTHAAAQSPWVRFELAWSLQHKPRNRILALLPQGEAPGELRPALNLVWQVPYAPTRSWTNVSLKYVLWRSGAKRVA